MRLRGLHRREPYVVEREPRGRELLVIVIELRLLDDWPKALAEEDDFLFVGVPTSQHDIRARASGYRILRQSRASQI